VCLRRFHDNDLEVRCEVCQSNNSYLIARRFGDLPAGLRMSGKRLVYAGQQKIVDRFA
jgi:hypothetical protein